MKVKIYVVREPRFPFNLHTSKDVATQFSYLGKSAKEMFYVLFLNNKNRVLDYEVISLGTIDHAVVYPREVVRAAIGHNSNQIILVHNHPGNDPTPSRDDFIMTSDVIKACKLLGIELLDHIIITPSEKYYSMKDGGTLPDVFE